MLLPLIIGVGVIVGAGAVGAKLERKKLLERPIYIATVYRSLGSSASYTGTMLDAWDWIEQQVMAFKSSTDPVVHATLQAPDGTVIKQWTSST
jgi:hypothetical protein